MLSLSSSPLILLLGSTSFNWLGLSLACIVKSVSLGLRSSPQPFKETPGSGASAVPERIQTLPRDVDSPLMLASTCLPPWPFPCYLHQW